MIELPGVLISGQFFEQCLCIFQVGSITIGSRQQHEGIRSQYCVDPGLFGIKALTHLRDPCLKRWMRRNSAQSVRPSTFGNSWNPRSRNRVSKICAGVSCAMLFPTSEFMRTPLTGLFQHPVSARQACDRVHRHPIRSARAGSSPRRGRCAGLNEDRQDVRERAAIGRVRG
jgi:hypothetical protein